MSYSELFCAHCGQPCEFHAEEVEKRTPGFHRGLHYQEFLSNLGMSPGARKKGYTISLLECSGFETSAPQTESAE